MQRNVLIIISDMHGYDKDSIPHYMRYDLDNYDCRYYSVKQLAQIKNSIQDAHSQYVEHGIQSAIKSLLELQFEAVSVLAFSIGGTIAWKAALSGLKIKSLIAVSSTRLRLEINKPDCDIKLIYASNDPYKPSQNWFYEMALEPIIIEGAGHDIYKQLEIRKIISEILSDC